MGGYEHNGDGARGFFHRISIWIEWVTVSKGRVGECKLYLVGTILDTTGLCPKR